MLKIAQYIYNYNYNNLRLLHLLCTIYSTLVYFLWLVASLNSFDHMIIQLLDSFLDVCMVVGRFSQEHITYE